MFFNRTRIQIEADSACPPPITAGPISEGPSESLGQIPEGEIYNHLLDDIPNTQQLTDDLGQAEADWELPELGLTSPDTHIEGLDSSKPDDGEASEPDVDIGELLDDPVSMYLREIGRTPLLTFREERQLARQLEVQKHLAGC